MFYRPLYITLLFLAGLLFSSQKGQAGINIVNRLNYKVPETLSKTSWQIASQIRIINDIITDSDDNNDDETSSKAKHKHPKTTITFQTKFDVAKQVVTSQTYSPGYFSDASKNYYSPDFLFSKTSISISIRSLRI